VFYCPEGEDPTMNFREGGQIMPRVFMEKWIEDCIPNQADKLERSPKLLKTLVIQKNFLPNDWALVADGISTAIPTIITSEFCGSEVIVLKDSATRATFLYNELGHLIIPPQGPTVVLSEIGRRNTKIQVNMGGGASSTNRWRASLEEDVQDPTIEADEAEEGDEEEEEPSQEPKGIILSSHDTSEEGTPSLHSHMQDTVHVEDELLSQHPKDVGVIHHVRDEDQHAGTVRNFGRMHGSRSGTEGMEVGRHVHDIHYSRGDVQSIEVGKQIGGTQHSTCNINIGMCYMATDVNATRNRLASIVVVSTPRASPTASENIPATVGNDDPLFQSTCGTPTSALERSVVQDSTDRWDGNVDGIGSGSQSLPLSFGEFLTASTIMEVREDGFYYDSQGIRHRIVPSIGSPNHRVLYQEVATVAEDHGHAIDEAENVCTQTTIEVSGTPTSSIERIPETQHPFPS
jgi:hypothetical protein